LKDVVTFIRRSEDAAYEAMKTDEDEPALSACLEHHAAVRPPLSTMEVSLAALAGGDASARATFVRAVHEYVTLRREHFRLDDRFAIAPDHWSALLDRPDTPIEFLETPETRRLYTRVIEAADRLAIGRSIPQSEPRSRKPAADSR